MRRIPTALLAVPFLAVSCAAPPAGPGGAAPEKAPAVPPAPSTPAPGRAAEANPEVRAVPSPAAAVRTGIDVLRDEGFARLRGKRVALITNGSGVDGKLRSTADLLAGAPGVTLAALFAPEHGVRGAIGAGAAVGDGRDPRTGVPVHSLYGKTKRPTREMLAGIDVLIFDIQDVGARPYTYLTTLRGALEAAAESTIEIVVLDRPDPLGGNVLDGPVLEPEKESFVGFHPVPLRYGMTPGEAARMMDAERGIGAKLSVAELDGWRRGMGFRETGLLWVAPSPNIPAPETCLLFPGFVLIEATNLSEGRGTTRPFALFGAPWLDADRMAEELNGAGIDGAIFRPTEFIPWDSKHDGKPCGGIEVHVTDPARFRACAAAAAAIAAARKIHPGELKIDASGFDRLAGCSWLREAIEAGTPAGEIVRRWEAGHEEYRKRREKFLLYR